MEGVRVVSEELEPLQTGSGFPVTGARPRQVCAKLISEQKY